MLPLYAARAEDLGQGDLSARPQRGGAVPGVRGERASGGVDHVAAGRRVGRPPVRTAGCFWFPGTRRADWVPYPGRGTSPGGSKERVGP